MKTRNFVTKHVRLDVRAEIRALSACGINLMVLSLVMVMLCSCGTTRHFQVQSDPEGALLLKRDKWSNAHPLKSPEKEKVTFLTKSEKYDFIAMKRGYLPDTVTVNRESPAEVRLRLKRIEGVPTELPPAPNIFKDKAALLPVDIDFVWHKGVGNLDKFELDEEQSIKCAEGFTRMMTGDPCIKSLVAQDVLSSFRVTQNDDLMQRLFSLNPEYLNYYPEPVVIGDLVDKDDLATVANYFAVSDEKYLLLIYCKSVRPTSGRVVGNIIAGSLAPVFAPYYTPSAFFRDNSTMASIFIIDAKTFEIVAIQHIIKNYDIYKNEQIEKLAGEVFASFEKNKN